MNSVYFGTNTLLPGLLTGAGHSDWISSTLTALNFGQLPASALMIVAAHRIERRVWPYVAVGCLISLTLFGVVSNAGPWTPFWAGALGLCFGIALPLALASPDLTRTSAAMFTISYALVMGISVAAGAVWDLTGHPALAFLPVGPVVLPLVLLTPTIRFHRDQLGARSHRLTGAAIPWANARSARDPRRSIDSGGALRAAGGGK